MKSTIEITEANFKTEVLEATQPVVLDFWADWCGPCKMLGPALEEVAAQQAGRAKVAKVNIDDNPSLAAQFGVQAIPTLIYFAGGQEKERTVGAVAKRDIVSRLEKLAAAA